MKKITLLPTILFLLVSLSAFTSQQSKSNLTEAEQKALRKKAIKDTMKIAEFIFEGAIVKVDKYNKQELYPVYTSIIVNINKVFKGNLKLGTVEIVMKDFNATSYNMRLTYEKISDSIEIFVCREAKEYTYDPKYNIDKVDNSTILTTYNPDLSVQFYGQYAYAYDSSFHSKLSVYRYLRKEFKIPIPKTKEEIMGDTLEDGTLEYVLYHHPEIVRGFDSVKRETEKQNQIVLQKLAHDSIESYKEIIKEKKRVDKDLEKQHQPTKTFEFSWDAYLRKYTGSIVEHSK